MSILSTSACVLQALSLSTAFGGPLFDRLGVRPAINRAIDSEAERGKVLHEVSHSCILANAISLGTAAVTYMVERPSISKHTGRDARKLLAAKDLLLGAAVASSFAMMMTEKGLRHQTPGRAGQTRGGSEPSTKTPQQKNAAMQRFLEVIGPINIALVGSVIAVSVGLGTKVGKSSKWNFVSRLLP